MDRLRPLLSVLVAGLAALPGCGQAAPAAPGMTEATRQVLAEVTAPRPLARHFANRTRMGTGALLPLSAQVPAGASPPAAAGPPPAGAGPEAGYRVATAAPGQVDLRPAMPPVYHQGPFMSCTAFAVVKGLGEYLLRREGDRTALSAAHFYAASDETVAMLAERATLDDRTSVEVVLGSMRSRYDDGRSLASAMATLEWAGAVPEADRPYPDAAGWEAYVAAQDAAARAVGTPQALRADVEPGYDMLYRWFNTYRQGAKAGAAPRLRIRRAAPARTLAAVRRALARELPVVLGVVLHEGAYGPEAARTGQLALPRPGEREVGGHAMLAVGYDDADQAVLLRNSWGPSWGEGGHARLPYAAFEAGLVRDGWTVGEP